MPDYDPLSDQRWAAWQQKGRARELRTNRRMGAVAVIVGIALAGRLGWLLVGM